MYCKLLIALGVLAGAVVGASGQEPGGVRQTQSKRGDVLWSNALDSAADFAAGDGAGQAMSAERGTVLEIDKPGAEGSMLRQFVLPVEPMRGRWIYLSAEVKAKDVSAKPMDWNGIKVMLKIEGEGGTQWPQVGLPAGSFEWGRFSTRVLVPGDARTITLFLGLEKVSGTVWFDDVRVTLAKSRRDVAAVPEDQVIFTGHAEARLRGAMAHPRMTKEDLRVLAGWGGNLVRWQLLHLPKMAEANEPAVYDRWLEGELKRLDEVLVWAKELGVKVVVDLHSPPGGRVASEGAVAVSSGAFWSNAEAQEHFVQVWRRIAERYKGHEAIWGFDLLNEPDDRTVSEACEDWQALAERAGRAVREVDEARTLIVEPADWGGAAGFEGFSPLDLERVVYSFHMYEPMAFTHQGVIGDGKAWAYPGEIDGKMWDKAALEKAMGPAIAFAKKYRVQMYVGEFSAARWAEGADRYLADVTEIFESHGWDWSYHAFREWQGWDLERGEDRGDEKRTAEPGNPGSPGSPGARLRVIQKWMRMNGGRSEEE